jgi:hypothetical protein
MKRVLPVVLAAVVWVPAAFAAIEYDFHQINTSEIEQLPSGDLNGHAIIDGERWRVDFVGGTTYPPGTYVVSNNGSRTLLFVDPLSKSFTEVNVAAAAAYMGSSKISVANAKSNIERLEDHPIVAGYPTDHYRMTVSYDMTVAMGALPVSQSVQTTVDEWTTAAFGEQGNTFLSDRGTKTGNSTIDDLVDQENAKIKGLALKQRIEITTTNKTSIPAESKLKINPTRKQTRDFIITSIKRMEPQASSFVVPAAYTKSDPRQADPSQTKIHMLSLEPSGN